MEIAEDTVAGADDRGRFLLDEDTERISIAGQDGIDGGPLIDDLGVACWRW
jgi:hypothetical protein